ncbi:copper amine oxidase N-terminal domain-containing protein [Alkaliphilus transvaalensis]|uniref:copper amine oxidase N-terminal domain-containing protein n=1 Tax=Alkaliphilus transvaalensis TaxID=114628 RepID=UPI00146FA710|nr:copper amine oxidase N-terminal domain-containing protein [Alkaliphilus transvaalensis]
MKLTITVFVWIMITITSVPIVNASILSISNDEVPIYIKMDKYFILYTYPIAPFIDQQGRLLIPLRMIQDLMGGNVEYNHTTKTASVELLDSVFNLTIDSEIAYVNKNEVVMDTIPVLKQDSMFLPLRLFLDHTDIDYNWDLSLKLLHITDERVLVGNIFKSFDLHDLTENHIDGNFHLQSYKIFNSKGLSYLNVKVKNLTTENVLEGKTDIQPLVYFRATRGGYSVDSYIRPNNKDVQEIKAGETLWVNKTIDLDDAAYIISVGRRVP